MSQQKLINYFHKHPMRWFTTLELAKETKQSRASVQQGLAKMRNKGEIDYTVGMNMNGTTIYYSLRKRK